MRLILCFLMIVTVPVAAHADDFWKDVAALYKEVRSIDSRLQDGMTQKEFVDKYHEWKASYNDFMDEHGENSCAKQAKKGEPTDESSVCTKFRSLPYYTYTLAEAVLDTIKLQQEYEEVSGIDQSAKIQESENQFQKTVGEASETLKEIKLILNKHR